MVRARKLKLAQNFPLQYEILKLNVKSVGQIIEMLPYLNSSSIEGESVHGKTAIWGNKDCTKIII